MALFIRSLEPAPATALALASGHHAHPDHPEDLEHPEILNFLNMVDILHIRGHRPRIRSHINRPVVVTGMIGMIETLIIPVYSCHHPSDWDDGRNSDAFFGVGLDFFYHPSHHPAKHPIVILDFCVCHLPQSLIPLSFQCFDKNVAPLENLCIYIYMYVSICQC